MVRQINNMSKTYNGTKQADGTKWDCELVSVHASRNRAALCMAQYGMSHVSSLVEVPQPFAELQEKLDMDVGSGPHVDFLDVQPNFGNGELMHGGGKAAPIDLTGEDEDEGAGPGGN